MHEITLGWDFEHHHPVMLVDRIFDFPTGEAVWIDLAVTDLVRPGMVTVVIGLCLYGLWRLGSPGGRSFRKSC
jgi:hypothetical protein